MSRFDDVDDQYDPHDLEQRVFDYWDDVDAYEQTVEHRSDGESFFFVDGPPYTSGSAHMGTTWNKTLKDVYLRFFRMQGYDVTDRPGYDMHGLPIETRVEERLGFENKKDIEEFGEENFIQECKEYAEEQLEGLQADFQDFGVWMDWDDPYKTVRPEYMEAAWWGFAKAAERGLVEKGNRSISQCPRCETAIANNEVEYDDVEDPSVYVKFDLKDRDGKIVIWTTTPWTIPANTFVAVDEEGDYVGVRAEKDGEEELLYVAEAKHEAVLKEGRYEDYETVEELSGEELIGWSYEHPLADQVPEHPDHEGAGEVYAADYVDTSGDGTGLVHSAPGHGEEDFERGHELGFPIFCPVDGDGVYTDEAGTYEGQFVKDADDEIIADLEDEGALLASGTVHHSYGHCWRCDTGIVQIVTDQWFITITDVKDELLANIEDSQWHPDWARDNRFRDFVEEAPDWNASRQRYWGIPLPVWTPEDRDDDEDRIVITDREELAERVDQEIDPETVDLHKDTVDELTITEDETTYTRVPDVFDVWLDSSVASWGTLDYPEDDSRFDELWPADFIVEAHDQTRGWFWSQLSMGSAALGDIPYEEVLMHGHALMPDGRAMSKSKDILIDPHEAIDRHGRDVMRLFLLSNNPQGDDMRFDWDGMQTMEDHLRTLWNVFRFPLPYMRLDDFDPQTTSLADVDDDLELVDEWVLARLQSTKAEMTDHFEDRRQDKAVDALLEFVVEDVSRFYVQAVRERMWEEEDSASKEAAYATLYRVLRETVALLAPYAPFISEEIYGTLTGDAEHDTVHMCDWPELDEYWVDEQLEEDVAYLRAIEEAGANARQQAGRKLRWPVPRVVVAADDDRVAEAVERHTGLLEDRLNAREIELVSAEERWEELQYSAEADMSELGPAFGDRAGQVMNALNEARIDDPDLESLEEAVEDVLEADESIEKSMVSFVTETPDDIAGTAFGLNGDDRGVVYVDASLTENIESEGYAREVIRRVQEMRKDLELDVEERIALDLAIDDDRVAELVDDREDLIREEVRADELRAVEDGDGHRKEWDVEGVTMEIAVEPLAAAEASD
ncbi:isoleucine--tRNA ligase [Natronobacterium gregoryi]|uniref:Isoleucine--tRNA ligase n=2 Tax=Natronobacterium gregoryi TaxID=44930 RepID=L0AGD0_NATGS|nr:isoleucine--tRNA ligase [Natronobacterium gregoryi]AFZ72881.1 isoleucyl-tRNA synthetase [Natronobacterium gregoryi SP2]ELY69628.1 isoleucyl-tRNA ligase [Natronobacterium gregoryi SP2]PLK21890.1 isoleucine--tRNA ligase [Natronobacterium gregoryi SP2]SFI66303.1 Isoleucyl-tRNA synthetase [Natronobacterium gregoryi]